MSLHRISIVVASSITAEGLIISQIVSLALIFFNNNLIRLDYGVGIAAFTPDSTFSAASGKSIVVFYTVAVSFTNWGNYKVTACRIFAAVKLKPVIWQGNSKLFVVM